jgi:hypothetical protein
MNKIQEFQGGTAWSIFCYNMCGVLKLLDSHKGICIYLKTMKMVLKSGKKYLTKTIPSFTIYAKVKDAL